MDEIKRKQDTNHRNPIHKQRFKTRLVNRCVSLTHTHTRTNAQIFWKGYTYHPRLLPQDITDETPDFLSQEKKGTKAHLELFIHWGIFLWEGERKGSFSFLFLVFLSFFFWSCLVSLSLHSYFYCFYVQRVREKKNKPPKTSHTNTGEAFLIFLFEEGELTCFSFFIRGRGILVFTSIKKARSSRHY